MAAKSATNVSRSLDVLTLVRIGFVLKRGVGKDPCGSSRQRLFAARARALDRQVSRKRHQLDTVDAGYATWISDIPRHAGDHVARGVANALCGHKFHILRLWLSGYSDHEGPMVSSPSMRHIYSARTCASYHRTTSYFPGHRIASLPSTDPIMIVYKLVLPARYITDFRFYVIYSEV